MSRRHFRWSAVLLLMSACATTPRSVSGEESGKAVAPNVRSVPDTRAHRFLSPAELMKRMEASPVQYRIQDLETLKGIAPEQLVDFVWPHGPETHRAKRRPVEGEGWSAGAEEGR